jgi:hypothetical protein
MSLIIETLVCVCGNVHVVETDSERLLKKTKIRFDKEHKKCKKPQPR